MNSRCRLFILSGLLASLCLSQVGQGQATPQTPSQNPPPEKRNPTQIKPGKDRWPVKTGSDADIQAVHRKPVPSTIEKMLALPRPVDLPLYESNPEMQNHRARPVETTLWTVEAHVMDCQLMPDGDYRVTLQGASGQTMIMELPYPDPAFVNPNGPFAAQIKAAREQFEQKAKPDKIRQPISLDLHARITGIGFFGRAYGAKKMVKGNLIQLHPALHLEWMDKPSEEFRAALSKRGVEVSIAGREKTLTRRGGKKKALRKG